MCDFVRYECPFCHQDALEIKMRPGRELTFAGIGANGNPMFTFKEAITSWKEKRNCK